MSGELVRDVVASVFLLGGGVLALGAGVGLVRFPDLLARMHAATKPQVLGLLMVLVGLAVRLEQRHAVWMLLLVAVFQLMTSPVAAHMVARAGYRTGKVDSASLVEDELTRDLVAAEELLAERRAQGRLDRAAEAPEGDVEGEDADWDEAGAAEEAAARQARLEREQRAAEHPADGRDAAAPDGAGTDDGTGVSRGS